MSQAEPKPMTDADREKYIESLRVEEDRVAHRNNKVRFGKQDIFGCVDVISYSPLDIFMDQTTDLTDMSKKKREYERMLLTAPQVGNIRVFIHGIKGYKLKRVLHIERHVQFEWLSDGSWLRTEMPSEYVPPVRTGRKKRKPVEEAEPIPEPVENF